MARSVACLAVLLALCEIGSCIRCYQCNSLTDATCAETVKPETPTVDCAAARVTRYQQIYLYALLPAEAFGNIIGSPSYCHTIVNESGTFIRTCLAGNPVDMYQNCQLMLKAGASSGKKITTCIACNTDHCNM